MSSRALSVSCSKSVTRTTVASPRSAFRKDFPATQSRACLISSGPFGISDVIRPMCFAAAAGSLATARRLLLPFRAFLEYSGRPREPFPANASPPAPRRDQKTVLPAGAVAQPARSAPLSRPHRPRPDGTTGRQDRDRSAPARSRPCFRQGARPLRSDIAHRSRVAALEVLKKFHQTATQIQGIGAVHFDNTLLGFCQHLIDQVPVAQLARASRAARSIRNAYALQCSGSNSAFAASR